VDQERLKRHDLTDEEWAGLEPLLLAHFRQGHRWADHRMVINGVFFRVRAGLPWRDLPGVRELEDGVQPASALVR
jgi:transposase